ncbi:MAG: YggS family pyridoxal phosphate-dependent enzyme [Planctomycetota bacterium]|jgi:pyridoxal phosphate enzyme (YggS family)
MSVSEETIAGNLRSVRERIAAALARAGRPEGSCRLLAVTKNRSVEEVAALVRAGQTHLGENRVQEADRKVPACRHLGVEAEWHLIGHLQRNKVKKALALFNTIHSVDSVRLLEAVARAAEDRGARPDVLLEVNVARETSKYGFAPPEVEDACRRAADLPSLRLVGLMTMAPFTDDPETVRPVFKGLRELRDNLNARSPYPEALTELSMGMSGDFEVAAEEGATWVRVGTALFEG